MNLTPSRNVKALFTNYFLHLKCKHYTTKQSKDIRKEFISFFMNEHDHKYVRSSPVVPFCDPTVPFVNAGMNQFKGIFLEKFTPQHPRVTNSQKCVRVSGKHNDIGLVGTDGHHHTFFEMLGNWSFGDYYKTEACRMAWELLTGPYGFHKNDLVITYFGGDKELGLPPDLECRDVWLNLGIHPNNLISSNFQENFWEMGATGPCGPCTEIHYRDKDGNLLEIWNIVFIQFHRQTDGTISSLPRQHVDTGMGLERITALLQNKKSNYDTDLFMPLMNAIHRKSNKVPMYQGKFGENAGLDNAYRILADHARMISICLADGVFPCRNLRLRNVLRRAISLSKNTFQCPSGMIISLYDQVLESLGDTYPELYTKMEHAKQIIMHEEISLANLELTMEKEKKALIEKYPEAVMLSNEFLPGLPEGYKQFKEVMKNVKERVIPGSVAFKLYDTFGLNEELIFKIAEINKLDIDNELFKIFLAEHKSKHKAAFAKAADLNINNALSTNLNSLFNNNLSSTVDSYKYDFNVTSDGDYVFPKLKSKLIAVLNENGDFSNSVNINSTDTYHLIFDKTNFYCEEGGQDHDIGKIVINNNVFEVNAIFPVQGFILHSGKFSNINESSEKSFGVGEDAELSINSERRISLMQHHTATHLLNAAVKNVLSNSVTCQLGSRVNSAGLVLDLAVYGPKLSSEALKKIADSIRSLCLQDVKVHTRSIDAQDLLAIDNVTTVPGEIYPETGLRLVEIKFPNGIISRELCCGTHVTSTEHIKNFTITSVRGAGGHAPIIRAVVGDLASQIDQLKNDALALYREFDENEISDQETIQERIKKIRNKLNAICKGDGALFDIRLNCMEILSSIEKRIKEENEKAIMELVQEEMGTLESDAKTNKKHFMTHFLVCSYLLQPGTLSLSMAVQFVTDRPILVLGCANGIIKATCRVPYSYIDKNFNAEKWLRSILSVFGTTIIPPNKNQDLRFIAHMKGKKVSLINCESLVGEAIEKGNEYASVHCPKEIPKDGHFSEEKLNKKRNHCS